MRTRDESAPNRVLILRAGLLGDTVFATSLIEPLRTHFGHSCCIDWVVGKAMSGLFRNDPRVRRVYEVRYRHLPLGLNPAKFRVVAASWREPYDLIVNLETGSFLNSLVRLVRASRKVGAPYPTDDDDRMGEHAVERLVRIYRTFLPEDVLRAAVPSLVAPAEKEFSLVPAAASGYLVLNPTNSHFRKNDYRTYRSWPLAHWSELIRRLDTERPEQLVLIGGPGEERFLGELQSLSPRTVSLVGRTSIEQLMAVLAGARAVVTTDTGPSHVAAALGTPVIVIFGPSDPHRTAPFTDGRNLVRVLSAGLPCGPCSLDGRIRDCPWNQCMHEVGPRHVLDELQRWCPAGEPR